MSESIPKYLLVEKHIKEAIESKKLTDKLPGERVLAKELGFSYMTIRKAIENLVNEGVLYKVPTKGAFINTEIKKRQNTRTIGYFLDSSINSGISSPYYSMIFAAIEKEATKQGYSLVYFSDNNLDRLDNTLNKLDGVIATCFPRIESTLLEIKRTTPLVVIDNSAADKTIPSVIIDNFNALIAAVKYIYSLGHTQIGFMTGLEDSDIGKSRYMGYQHGLRLSNLDFDPQLICSGNYSYEAGIDGAAYFLSLPEVPSAIICANDSMALGAMKRFKQARLRIPEDISLIGFDDIEVASQIDPALTTVAAPVKAIANTAVSMLKDMIENVPVHNQHIALPAQLEIRQSCMSYADAALEKVRAA